MTCISDYNRIDRAPLQEWRPSESGKYKVNFDGASFGNPGLAAIGCVMRDCHGNIIGVKGGPMGVCDAMLAETMGLLEGLKLAKSKGARGCTLERDLLTVISWGREKRCGSWRLHHLFVEIKSLVNALQAELSHVPRCQNSLANSIAKWSVGQIAIFEGKMLPEW